MTTESPDTCITLSHHLHVAAGVGTIFSVLPNEESEVHERTPMILGSRAAVEHVLSHL